MAIPGGQRGRVELGGGRAVAACQGVQQEAAVVLRVGRLAPAEAVRVAAVGGQAELGAQPAPLDGLRQRGRADYV